MDPVLLKYAMADVPRYTSYPTAVQFASDFPQETVKRWLGELDDDKSLSAYVHVPFCEKLCWYCGCHMSVPNSYDRAAQYTDLLVREIAETSSHVGGKKGRVEHLHFGGGTPTYLKSVDIERIVSAIDTHLGLADGGEVAIEMDPRTFSRQAGADLVSMGFNRASFGVQDFDRTVQEKINRIQPFEQVEQCMNDLRDVGINAINFDLIYGLPGQTLDSVIETAHLTAKLKPSRIAVFGYAHVPWFKRHMKMIRDEDLPGVSERYQQTIAITETLVEEGYIAIGLDHFVLPEDNMADAAQNRTLRRNFQGYTVDAADALIGFGVSSISEFPQGFAQGERDTLSWGNAIEAGNIPINRGLEKTAEDHMRAEIIEKLMCYFTVDPVAIAESHGFSKGELIEAFERLKQLESDGMAVIKGNQVTIPESRHLFVRSVARAFDAHYVESPNRHAKAV